MVQVDQLLKKNFWIVILPLVAIAAFLNAQAVTQLVGISLGPDEKTLAAAPAAGKVAPSTVGTARNLSVEPLLERNPFDHVTGSLKPAPVLTEEGSPSGPVDTSDPWNAPKCDGVKVLIIAASQDPEWSFAAFSSGGDGKSIMRRRGGEVNGKQVHFVGWDRVWLETGGSLCQASLFDQPNAPAAAPPPTPAPTTTGPTRGGAKPLDPALAKGIQKISATEYNIDRGVVDKILADQAELMRQARIQPEPGGGLRMLGIRPDALLGVLGMENGDVLKTINGFDISNPEKALEAFARLRTADKLTISLGRKGQNTNIDYNIK